MSFSKADPGVAAPHEVEQLVTVLADERLEVVARDVVPLDTVLVEVVEDGQAGLVVPLRGFPVVRLSLAVAASGAPVTGVPLGGRSDLGSGSGPEPSVDVSGLQVGPVAAVEVALPSRSPDVLHVSSDDPLLDEFIFLWGFQADGIHAMSPADVPGVEPVDFQGASGSVFPTEEV